MAGKKTTPKPASTAPAQENTAPSIPIETLIALKSEGKSSAAIAAIVGCSRQNVDRRLNAVVGLIKDIDRYEDIVIKQLKASVMQSISMVTPDKLKKASLSQLGVFAAIGIDKIRLLEGKSTQNISHRVIVKDWSRERASIAGVLDKLRGQISALEGTAGQDQEQDAGPAC